MKRLLLIALLLPLFSFSQTRTSVTDGNFWNPLTWTPVGLPTSGETVIINHDVVMDLDIWYTAGSITINVGGSLIEDATDRAFWVDGTGSLINNGTFTVNQILVSSGSTLANTGDLANIDSLWNQGTFTSSGVSSIVDFLNDETATCTNTGTMNILNDMNNQGLFINTNTIDLVNDFSNCNVQTMDALFINDGIFCIAADMTNCIDDTLAGSGDYFIGGSSSNFGVFDGTHTFHTPSGTIGIPGTVESGVTVTTGSCTLELESGVFDYSFYPNPTTDKIQLSITGANYQLYASTGKLLMDGTIENYQIDLTNLEQGVYILLVEGSTGKRLIKQ